MTPFQVLGEGLLLITKKIWHPFWGGLFSFNDLYQSPQLGGLKNLQRFWKLQTPRPLIHLIRICNRILDRR